MDETSLRAQLELATSADPPLRAQAGNALRAGRKSRRRAVGAASLSAAAVVLVGAVTALSAGAGHQAGRSQSAAAGQAAETGTAYVALNNENKVVPISLATNTAGTPIKVPDPLADPPFITSAAVTPNGRTVYEVGEDVGNGTPVTPIDTATNTAGPAINVGDVGGIPQDFVLAPDGKTAYVTGGVGLFRIDTATGTASKVTDCSPYGCGHMALTPDGAFLYVIDQGSLQGPRTVTVIRTATNTVLTRITLPVPDSGINIPLNIAITPDGKTAYVVDGTYNTQPGASSVVPINVATNTPLAPIKIQAPGDTAGGIVIAPDGQTAYLLNWPGDQSSPPYRAAITPIDIATNHAEPAINLPASPGEAYYMALTPNGKTLYVLVGGVQTILPGGAVAGATAPGSGVIPVSTASGTVLPTISVPRLCNVFTDIAITPDGKTIYVGACIQRTVTQSGHTGPQVVGGGVVPISTATNTAGQFINLGQQPDSITFAP
jgi:DNA-binding beta-propeller fold protein YncE